MAYAFQAEPRALTATQSFNASRTLTSTNSTNNNGRTIYRSGSGNGKVKANLMNDKRIIRGSTYAPRGVIALVRRTLLIFIFTTQSHIHIDVAYAMVTCDNSLQSRHWLKRYRVNLNKVPTNKNEMVAHAIYHNQRVAQAQAQAQI
jgi:hypothetical protein